MVKESGETVFATTILPNAKAKQGEAFIGIVSVPLGGYLAPGMQLSIDKGKAYKILFETCNQAGCHAGFPITGAVLASFRKGKAASFRLWTTKTKPADVSVSLKGLPDALAAITKGGV